MDKNGRKCVNIKTKEGKIIVSLYLEPGQGFLLEAGPDSTTGEKTKGGKSENGNGSSMTHPQKRLLFRLLADQGIEGDKAHEHLKKLFQVTSLIDVSKMEASKMIEHMLKEAKGDATNDRVPF